MAKLLAARKFLSEGLPGEPVYGFVPDAGLPKNFRRAARSRNEQAAALLPAFAWSSSRTWSWARPAGLVLADLGAEVIKVEPEGKGDPTRYLKSTGAGFFASFSRNKKSVTLDLASEAGIATAKRLIGTADVFLENFRPGALAAKGLGYEDLSKVQPAAHLLLLEGIPARTLREAHGAGRGGADDERARVHDGPVGQPLRAGRPVNDMMGGMFGAIAILAALRERDRTGEGPVRAERALRERARGSSPRT
jgi:crotonobetainyl-CoA:carnitine CoA-transferase CaiB-like acyl-CoA transferase